MSPETQNPDVSNFPISVQNHAWDFQPTQPSNQKHGNFFRPNVESENSRLKALSLQRLYMYMSMTERIQQFYTSGLYASDVTYHNYTSLHITTLSSVSSMYYSFTTHHKCTLIITRIAELRKVWGLEGLVSHFAKKRRYQDGVPSDSPPQVTTQTPLPWPKLEKNSTVPGLIRCLV